MLELLIWMLVILAYVILAIAGLMALALLLRMILQWAA